MLLEKLLAEVKTADSEAPFTFLGTDRLYPQEWKSEKQSVIASVLVLQWFPLCVLMQTIAYIGVLTIKIGSFECF